LLVLLTALLPQLVVVIHFLTMVIASLLLTMLLVALSQ